MTFLATLIISQDQVNVIIALASIFNIYNIYILYLLINSSQNVSLPFLTFSGSCEAKYAFQLI